MRRAVIQIIVAAAIANLIATGLVLACGPDIEPFPTVAAMEPADWPAFERGQIGVIRPHYRRVVLAMAYRVLNAQPPLRVDRDAASAASRQDEWDKIKNDVLGTAVVQPVPARTRRVRDYVVPLNCLDDAFATAVRTFNDRQSRYGAGSPELRAWVAAQAAVFANCDEEPLVLPEAAPANADALTRADRAYQSAAAYFYAMQFDEAARRFRAIGDDASSPWRPYGRYLSARARIRTVTMASSPSAAELEEGFADAEQQLTEVIADPVAAPVHASARGLIAFVQLRIRPADQRRILAEQITTAAAVPSQALDDFEYALRGVVTDYTEAGYETMAPALRGAPEVVDWIATMKSTVGTAGRDHAIARWRDTRSVAWLVAALTHANGEHEAADALLAAAAAIPSSAAAFPTVSFLRVRLLIALNRVDEARRVLATLPDEAGPGVLQETVNLYRGERLMVASTLEEFLKAAPRRSLPGVTEFGNEYTPMVTFDEDAAVTLAQRLPLDRMIEAGVSTTLPGRLRTRVAVAAFTRAILLNRHDAARRVVPALRALAPQIAADLDRYMSETTADAQHRAAVLLLLRTPGMTKDVRGLEDIYSHDLVEPRRSFENFVPVWWCAPSNVNKPARGEAASELIHALYPSHIVPYPSFITAAERAAVEQELAALDAIGQATRYLAAASLEWAEQRPQDPLAAEALSRVVNGWRRACRDAADAELARRAFETLHRQFAGSDWAKRTPYWYR
jgi:hypothetical protein